MSEAASKPLLARAPGETIPDWHTSVSRDRQAAYHDAAEMPLALFADRVEPSILANDTILAMGYMKQKGADALHAGQRVIQGEPVRFDEPLCLKGTVISTRPLSKGTLTVTRFEFHRPNGTIPFVSENTSLKVDAEKMRSLGGGRTGLGITGQRVLAEKHPTPARVMAYSVEFPAYVVHFEPEAARSIGLRAPIAQGLMSLSWMMEAVAGEGLFESLDFQVSFRQPIHWDDRVRIVGDDAGGYFCANGSDEICSIGQLSQISR